jgi:choline transport protein
MKVLTNCRCVIVGAGLIFELAYFVWKRKEYHGPTLDEQLAEVVQGVDIPVHMHKGMPQNPDTSKELAMSKVE